MHEIMTTSSYRDGRKRGRVWASVASAKELQRIAQLRTRLADDWRWFFRDRSGGFTPGERLYFEMWPADDGDRRKANAFWKSVLWERADEQAQNAAWVRGFAEGLLSPRGNDALTPPLDERESANPGQDLSAAHLRRIKLLVESIGWDAASQQAWLRRNRVCSFRALTAARAEVLIQAMLRVELARADSVEEAEAMLGQERAKPAADRPILRIVSDADDCEPGLDEPVDSHERGNG